MAATTSYARAQAILMRQAEIYESQNPWGIPDLLPHLQLLEIDQVDQLHKYGSKSRRQPLRADRTNVVHFYTDDYRFANLWIDPTPILDAGPAAIVEPNYTTNDLTPPVTALWRVFQKRWLARYYQEHDICISVDLNMYHGLHNGPDGLNIPLIGVPTGWTSYFTRAYSQQLHLLDFQHDIACQHAGHSNVLFNVFAGGIKARDYVYSQVHRGWRWWPEWWHER